MAETDHIENTSGEVMLSIALLYWSLHDRLDSFCSEFTKQERLFLTRLVKPSRIGDMAKSMQALPSTLTALADGLEAKGYIARHRDPDDRRAWLLELTDKGRAMRQDLLDRVDIALRESTGLAEKDLDNFGELMLQVRNNILANGLPKGLPI